MRERNRHVQATHRTTWYKTLEAFRDSAFEFYLTGSRFAQPEQVTLDTDWDFFTQDSPEVRQFLTELGFEGTESYRNAQETTAVYRKGMTDVQLCKDAAKKNAIQNILHKNNLLTRDKQTRRLIWDVAYAVYSDLKS